MRVERLVESRATILALSEDEASELAALGRRLSARQQSTGSWMAAPDQSVIECLPFGPGQWSVRVLNSIGIVRVGELQLVVEPKIPLPHVLHLFERSGSFPRLDVERASLESAETLWPLVAAAYLSSLECLIRAGLASGYQEARADLRSARGRIITATTATALMKGRVALQCEFEDFSVDTALNRVLKAAAERVAMSGNLSWDLRRRAARVIQHLEGISELRPLDLVTARPERHTSRYVLPLQLARHVLDSTGRAVEAGLEAGFGFLIRTPEMVEEALRRTVASALEGLTEVTKETLALRGSHHSLTPDLAFGSLAVGDVKYKVWAGDWDRADLYQLVAFATGFRVNAGLRVGFTPEPHGRADIRVGKIQLSTCDWAYSGLEPHEAEERFVQEIRAWWKQVGAESARVRPSA